MNMKSAAWLVAAALLGAAAVVVYVAVTGNGDASPAPRIGDVTAERRSALPAADSGEVRPAPDFSLATLDGGSFQLSEHAGEVVVVNFWATWCAPCRIEIPELIEMQSEMGEEGIQIVGISLDHQSRDVVEEFASEVGFNYPILLDDGKVADQFGGVYALPTTIIIDKDGMIRRQIAGLVTKQVLTPILEELSRG